MNRFSVLLLLLTVGIIGVIAAQPHAHFKVMKDGAKVIMKDCTIKQPSDVDCIWTELHDVQIHLDNSELVLSGPISPNNEPGYLAHAGKRTEGFEVEWNDNGLHPMPKKLLKCDDETKNSRMTYTTKANDSTPPFTDTTCLEQYGNAPEPLNKLGNDVENITIYVEGTDSYVGLECNQKFVEVGENSKNVKSRFQRVWKTPEQAAADDERDVKNMVKSFTSRITAVIDVIGFVGKLLTAVATFGLTVFAAWRRCFHGDPTAANGNI